MRRVTPAIVLLFSSLSPLARADAPTAAPVAEAAATPVVTPVAGPPSEVNRRLQIPDWRFVINNLLLFRYNPIGLEDQIRVGVQRRILHSDSPLFRDTFVFFGSAPKLNPAYAKIGPSLEIQPLSILNVRAAVEIVEYFSTFGFLQSYNSPLANYSDSAMSAADKIDNAAYATSGVHAILEPTFQLKLGSFALRNKFSVEYWRMNLRGSDTVFYDATLDTLVPGNGWVIANDLDALYLTKFGLTVGARYSVVKPFYRKSDYAPGDDTNINRNGHQRLGPILAYTFFDHGFTAFNKPTVLVITAWYLQHQYRTGLDQSQAVPYLVVGFAFQSDVMK